MNAAARLLRALVRGGAVVSVLAALHAAVNTRLLRRPPAPAPAVTAAVAVVLPVRDEADQVVDCLDAVLDQRGVPGLRVVVVDDFWQTVWGPPGVNQVVEDFLRANFVEVARFGAYRVLAAT